MPNQELQCPFCEKTSSRGTGLASHIRGSHPKQYPGWKKSRGNAPRAQAAGSPARVAAMPGGLQGIIANLENQKNAIEMALTALRAVDGLGFEGNVDMPRTSGASRVTSEGRERLSAAMKK